MDVWTIAMLLFAGMMAGNILYITTIHWAVAIHEVAKPPAAHPLRMALITSLFNAGPWLLVAASILIYFEFSEAWMPWVLLGAVSWVSFLCLNTYRAWRQMRERQRENAA